MLELLWIPTIIWFIGIIVLGSPRFLWILVKIGQKELKKKEKQKQNTDTSGKIYYKIERKLVETARHKYLCLITSIVGAFIMTFGFVAFGYIWVAYI